MKIKKKCSKVNVFISILLIISSFLSYYIFYINEESNFNLKMHNSASYFPNSYKIIIPGEIDKEDNDAIYKKIIETLDKYKGSIFYGRFNEENKSHTEYIYDKSNKYTSNFLMKSGEPLRDKDMDSKKYTATYITNDKLQIGVMSKFNKRSNMEIKTLKSMVDDNFNFSGTTYIAFKDPVDIKSFLTDLENSLETKGIQEIPKDKLVNPIHGNVYIYVVIINYFLIILIILYQILKSYKKIAIKKLMGYSFKTLYLENVLNILKINLIAGILPLIFMSFYFFDNLNSYVLKFLLKFIGVILIETGILLVLSLLIHLYIKFISIPNMIKNKKPLTPIICLNYFIKILCLLALVFFLNRGINSIKQFNGIFFESYNNWDKLNSYMHIASYNMTIDEFNKFTNDKGLIKKQKNIYKDFNRKGALLADFSNYLPQIRSVRKSETNIYYETDNIMVNPNYLKMYKIYDEDNLEVNISDEDKNYIILIPEKYKKDEKNILKYLDSLKKRSFYALGENQKTKIIWIKNDQNIFTISPEINPSEGNCIKNPLIQVITENNILDSYYDFHLNLTAKPFKIKTFNGLSGKETVKAEYKKYGIEKYLGEVSKVDEQVKSEIENIKKNIKLSLLFSTTLILTTILIIVQNSYNYVDKYKQKLAIKKLCGYKIWNKHSNYLISILIAWNIIFCISILIFKINLSRSFFIIIFGMIIEIIISAIALINIEKQKIVEVIKGE